MNKDITKEDNEDRQEETETRGQLQNTGVTKQDGQRWNPRMTRNGKEGKKEKGERTGGTH